MGVAFDSPEYKEVVNGPLSLCGIAKLGKAALAGKNPMLNGSTSDNAGFTRLNKDSAIALAKAFGDAIPDGSSRKPFVFISAEDWNPIADKEYVASKRAAELELALISQLRSVFVRPGFMYDAADNTATVRSAIGSVFQLGAKTAQLTGVKQLVPPAVSVQTVASAVVEALGDPLLEGVVELEALQKFESMAAAAN